MTLLSNGDNISIMSLNPIYKKPNARNAMLWSNYNTMAEEGRRKIFPMNYTQNP